MGVVRPARRHPLAVVILATAVAACTTSSSPSPAASTAPSAGVPSAVPSPAPSAPPAIPIGGTVRVGLPAKGDNAAITDVYVDPHRAEWQDALFRCCLARTLLSYNGKPTADGGTVLRPDLAEALPEVSADGLTWTFHLRDGLRYAPPYDDTTISSRDIIRGIERVSGPGAQLFDAVVGSAEFRDGVAPGIAGLEAPDDRTLIVRLTRPDADIATGLSMPASVPVPEGAADGHDDDYGHFFVSSGPYMYEGSETMTKGGSGTPLSAKTGPEAAVLVRNPSWERATDPLRGAWVDRIELGRAASFEDDRARLASGAIDIAAYEVRSDELAALSADPQRSSRLAFATFPRLHYLPMNMALPPFDDVAVRRAVNLAIDRAAIAELRAGTGPGATTMRIARHAIPDSFENNLLLDYDPYPSPGDHGDTAGAREAMKASRYDTDKDGRCDGPACTAVPIMVHPNTTDEQVAVVEAGLAEIGITLTRRADEAIPEDLRAHNGLFVLAGWGADTPTLGGYIGIFAPPFAVDELLISLSGSAIGASPEQLADAGYGATSVPSAEQKSAECLALTASERFVCAAELDQLIMEQAVAMVPIGFPEAGFLRGQRVRDYSIDQAFIAPALDQISLEP